MTDNLEFDADDVQVMLDTANLGADMAYHAERAMFHAAQIRREIENVRMPDRQRERVMNMTDVVREMHDYLIVFRDDAKEECEMMLAAMGRQMDAYDIDHADGAD